MTADPLAELCALQDADGCFGSWVVSSGVRTPDRNGYVAALVLRTLRHLPASVGWTVAAHRALDWIGSCRSPRQPAAYAFWPERTRPGWAAGVPADVDDTAVMVTELVRHGRVDRPTALRSVCTVLVASRLEDDPAAVRPPWVAPGSYLTWVAADAGDRRGPGAPNPVDACVNANVVALLSLLGVTHLPGHDAAVRTVTQGVAWAGSDRLRLAALTPFYPAPRSLADAVAHAVECGATQLRGVAARLAALPPSVLGDDSGSCRSAYGSTVWQAPALDTARALSGRSWS